MGASVGMGRAEYGLLHKKVSWLSDLSSDRKMTWYLAEQISINFEWIKRKIESEGRFNYFQTYWKVLETLWQKQF